MSDFFHEGADAWREEAWEVIRSCTYLDWLVLTKRPQRIASQLPSDWKKGYPNVWLGTTVENQSHIQRVDTLTKVPAAIHFVSAEPLLGPIRFGKWRMNKLDWIITGCERAAKAKRRTMAPDWVRHIRDECDSNSVALFHKQYYEGSTLVYDGMIDGEHRQDWPSVSS